MGHAHAEHVELKNPGPFRSTGALQGVFVALAVIGIATFATGLKSDEQGAWSSLLLNHFYFMSLALGGLFFAAIQWLTGAMWSAPVRRVSEAFSAYLPIALVTFVLVYLGRHTLFTWTHMEHVKGDAVLEGKSGYLSDTFFLVRNIIAVVLWILFGRAMIANSVAQDKTKDYGLTLKNRVWAPLFLAVFAVTFTMASFDQMMSLDPHWFSTMFGVYCFAGLFYSVLALVCLVSLYLRAKGYLADFINDNHVHDMGKFMFAFTVFWAYIGFSQFMLIWYANLPEETEYFLRRMQGGWFPVSAFLLFGKFFVPFFVLMKRDAKRCKKTLIGMAIFMLVAQWIDVLWMVQPEFYKDGPHVGWMQIGTMLGFLGLFGLMVVRFLAKHNVVAIGDPRLEESVLHHHQ